ncbi:TonB-dependent receptor [Lysobacter sp. A421]
MSKPSIHRILRRSALTVALGLCFAGAAQAQSTSGGISGIVAGGEGSTIVISNNSGFSRTVSSDASGRYSVGSLPIGDYTVAVQRNGQTVGTKDITVIVGRTAEVSFAGGGATTLGTVTVTAANVPAIDITALDTRTIVTAAQLARLPIQHSAESIALLAPGANAGAGGFFGTSVSFGGAGVSENAYYINGYFSGEPLSNIGGFSMPYNSIAQQETYTGGYSAQYGRSDGGVINQVGKSGTNEVHFGGQVTWTPKASRSDQRDIYYPDLDFSEANSNPNIPLMPERDAAGDIVTDANGDVVYTDETYQYAYGDPGSAGTLYSRDSEDEDWRYTMSGYISGPLIKDRLFAFVAAEWEERNTNTTPESGGTSSTHNIRTDPKIYAKLNWNISDNHLLEYSYMHEDNRRKGRLYEYDFDTGTEGAQLSNAYPTELRTRSDFSIFKYTGYLTDSLTLNATYGQADFLNQSLVYSVPGQAYLFGTINQDPRITGGDPINNDIKGYRGRDGRDNTSGLRADLEWLVGDHTLTVGIDNLKTEAENEGNAQINPSWQYSKAAGNIVPALGVGSPVSAANPDGYYVNSLVYFDSTSMTLDQKAWFLEDRWQMTDNFLLSVGIRNDQFTNSNNVGEVYMDAKNQWAPRLGASWDVFGDSSFKLFANAGRYFLAMPNNVAIRGASASTYTRQYYTYTGIDQYGNPTGLTEVPGVDGAPPPGPVSANGEYGEPVDVLAFAPKDMENMYQDEYILGFDKTWGESWAYGAKLTYRDLKSSIDDVCDSGKIAAKMTEIGLDPDSVEIAGCYMFNPGGTNTFSLANVDGSGRTEVKMSGSDWGFEQGTTRTYKAIDLYLERPFDGKWEVRVDYTYSKLEGNNEGQVKSEFGQDNISKTQDWDAAEIMAFSDGYLANDRRHQLKVRGSYEITPEWMVSGKLRVLSGMPISCLGYYSPDGSIDESSTAGDPIGYGSSYHTCFGQVRTPGEERTSWTHPLDLSVSYRPAMFDHKLALGLQVFNVLNERKVTQVQVQAETDPYTVDNTFMMPLSQQTPRYVMFTASVDF